MFKSQLIQLPILLPTGIASRRSSITNFDWWVGGGVGVKFNNPSKHERQPTLGNSNCKRSTCLIWHWESKPSSSKSSQAVSYPSTYLTQCCLILVIKLELVYLSRWLGLKLNIDLQQHLSRTIQLRTISF